VRSFVNGFQAGRRSFGRPSLRLARQPIETRDGVSVRRLRACNHEISRDRGGGGRSPVASRFIRKPVSGTTQWLPRGDDAATANSKMKLALPA
jgi:hypothetical protein